VEPQVRTAFETSRPLDLVSTLAPMGGPSLRFDGPDAWRATRTPDGPATLRLRHVGGTVEVEAWGPGAEWAAEQAPWICGEHDDATGFQPQHRLIAGLHRRNPGLRLPRTQAVFEAFVPAVLAQKVTTIEADASYRALLTAIGEPAPGPVRLKILPSPQVLARTPYWVFHRFGIERRRAEQEARVRPPQVHDTTRGRQCLQCVGGTVGDRQHGLQFGHSLIVATVCPAR